MSKEILSHETNFASEIAEFFKSKHYLEEPEMRRDYFQHLSSDDFLDLVQQIAGLVRTGQANNQHFDGETVGLMTHEVPDQRDKEQLLVETWETAQHLLNDPDTPDDDALDYAALTVAGGILYTHPFIDGNGRTARVLSYMIATGDDDTGNLESILGESNGGGSWHIAPAPIVAPRMKPSEGPQPDRVEWEDAFAGEATDALGGAIANSLHGEHAIRKFIEQYGDAAIRHVEENSHTDSNGVNVLDAERFIKSLVHDPEAGTTNADDLLRIHREARSDYVQRFLQSMRLKARWTPYKLTPKSMEVRDFDSEDAKSRKKKIQIEFAKRALKGQLTPADQQLIRHRSHSKLRR